MGSRYSRLSSPGTRFLSFSPNLSKSKIWIAPACTSSLIGKPKRYSWLGVQPVWNKLTLRNWCKLPRHPHFHKSEYNQHIYIYYMYINKYIYTYILYIICNIYIYLDLPLGCNVSAKIQPQKPTNPGRQLHIWRIQLYIYFNAFQYVRFSTIFPGFYFPRFFHVFFHVFLDPEVWSPEATPAARIICPRCWKGTSLRRRNLWRLGWMGFDGIQPWMKMYLPSSLIKNRGFSIVMPVFGGVGWFLLISEQEVVGKLLGNSKGRRKLVLWKFWK